MNIGTIDNARIVVFSGDKAIDHRYVLTLESVDYLELLERFPKFEIKRTTHVYIDDPDGQWFACANVDCFDPPYAIIRARTFEQAYETFCDEYEKWIAVDEVDAKDYPEDERDYNNNGTHIDTEGVQVWPLTLESVETGS